MVVFLRQQIQHVQQIQPGPPTTKAGAMRKARLCLPQKVFPEITNVLGEILKSCPFVIYLCA